MLPDVILIGFTGVRKSANLHIVLAFKDNLIVQKNDYKKIEVWIYT